MPESLLAEANRQFTLCNACRYCEGLCAVFPAMEDHSTFDVRDLAYLANLCHDCRSCLDACPFTAPHEYAIDIPRLMSRARVQSFETLAVPGAAWRLLGRPWIALAVAAAALVFYAAVALLTGDPARIVRSHAERSAFYHVVGYTWLLVPFGLLGLAVLAAVAAGAARLAAGVPAGARRGLLRVGAHARAIADVCELRNLRGGGGGCRYPDGASSAARRRLHHLVFYGFGLMFLATLSAAFEQELRGMPPPYGWLSAPVLLGLSGGIATLGGCGGFLVLGTRRRDPRKSEEARRLDRLFTVTLLAATATGLLTLGLRSTVLMGPALIVHLGTIGMLFVTLPYGKLVHAAYRYTALVRSHVERGP